MKSSPNNVKETSKSSCKCTYCCLTPLINYPNSLSHQNSTNITNSSTFQYDFATATISSLYPYTQFTNPESLPTLQQSFRRFTGSFPQYLSTVECDQIRATDFPHLSKTSHVCLDYIGHALFTFPQQEGDNETNDELIASSSEGIRAHSKTCHFEVSHMVKEPSLSELEFELKVKKRIMSYLNVLEDDYSMFFTANQTSALRIVAQAYPFKTNKNLLTVYDHENEGVEAMIIEASKNKGARVSSAEFKWPKLKIHCKKLEEMIVGNVNNNNVGLLKKKKMNKGLFVFPIQSRISGARYSYQWMSIARENGWHVLLDVTSLGAKDMDTLGLSLFQPDFLICTFYKVFGEDPSGFSCLLVKKSNQSILDQSYFSSTRGIVTIISSNQTSGHQSENCYVECEALDHADTLGLALIGTRTRCLLNWLANALLALIHPNSDKDVQLVQVYGPRVRFDRGPSLAFNVFDWKGEKVDPMLVQKLGDRHNISLGYGCLKHVWFSERYEVERNKVMDKKSKKEGEMKKFQGRKRDKVKNEIVVVTASICFLTNFEDVYRLWEFVAKFLDADFVEKERWRYTALNQKTIHV